MAASLKRVTTRSKNIDIVGVRIRLKNEKNMNIVGIYRRLYME